jgi:hypothetical protein
LAASELTDLLLRALQAEHAGRFDEAIALLHQVASEYDKPLSLDARLRLGKLLATHGSAQADEARDLLRNVYERANAGGAPRLAAQALHLLALSERNDGRRDEGLRLLE